MSISLAGTTKQLVREGLVAALFVVACVSASFAAENEAAIARYHLKIQRQALDPALKDLAQQTGLQIMRFSDAVKGDAIVGPLDGLYSVDQALQLLLASSGLTYRSLNSRAFIVVAPEELSHDALPATPENGSHATETSRDAQAPTGDRSVQPQATSAGVMQLEEIIVTAQKIEERLRDIPMSLTAITAADLEALGAARFVDFASTVPALRFTTSGIGQTQVHLRGITSGYNVSPTVGIYVDDVPYGSSTPFAASAQLGLDVGLFDVNRIEVLRGPQGTLYGASTMGGLLKYVTNVPDPTRFTGSTRAGVASTRHGGVSYDAASAINLPLLESKAALRVGGYYSRSGGYVDNLALARDNVDESDVYGGRVDFVYAPTNRASVRLVAFAQDVDRGGSIAADVDRATGAPIDGELDQRRALQEPFEQRFRLASATVNIDLGSAALTSISSYQSVRSHAVTDFSALYVPAFGGSDVLSAVGLIQNVDTEKLTQEVRVAGRGRVFDWLAGVFYTNEDSTQFQSLPAFDAEGALSPVNLLTVTIPSRFEEYAGFGNLTWHLTDRVDLTAGVRYAHNSQSQEQQGSGLLVDSASERSSNDDVATYLANVRYRVNDHVMPYLRFATGYRPGGPNAAVNEPSGEPLANPTFDADKLTSYEAGLKFGTADRRFSADIAVYHIDWDDMQITAIREGLGLIANAAKARSRGAEFTASAMPVPGLTLTGAVGYMNAELSENAPALGGIRGESLPDVPAITAVLSADYRFGWNNRDLFAGTTLSYLGDRTASFDGSVGMPQYELPDYTAVDLRAGFVVAGTRVQLYCKNVGDERGQLSAMTGTSVFGGPANVSLLQPRTFALSVDVTF